MPGLPLWPLLPFLWWPLALLALLLFLLVRFLLLPLRLLGIVVEGALGLVIQRKHARWLARTLVFTLAGVALLASPVFGRRPIGERRARMERSPQWEGWRFVNPEPIQNHFGLMARDPFHASAYRVPDHGLASEPVEPGRFGHAPTTGLRVTWLGHSTILVEIDGRRLLVDPIWSERSSPFQHVGPRRFQPPLLALRDLPPVDAVLVSHDHHDHLDPATVEALNGSGALFVVPLGVGMHLEAWGVPSARIVELDWWERARVGEVEIVATPARHASGRGPFTDRDRTLWSGFALLGPAHRVYYSGDTGFFPGLAEIGARLGPFDAALIEAGAYGRAWPDWHLGPEQAVRAAGEVRARLLLPVHWGLFDLAYHGWTEPAERVLVAATAAGQRLAIPRPGQSVEPAAPPPPERWWPDVPWRTAAEDPIVSSRIDGERPGGVPPR